MNQYYQPPQITDSDSCSEDEFKQNLSSTTVTNPSRKRRRGIIEKRRRDRINSSLSELKRLVPQALEKSGMHFWKCFEDLVHFYVKKT